MFWTALFALVFNLVCHFGLDGPRLPFAPELVGLICLASWLTGGSRGALILLPAAGACLWAGWALDNRLAPELAAQDIVVEGTVCSVPKKTGRAVRFMLRMRQTDGLVALPNQAYIGWYDSEVTPEPGDTWRLVVRLRRPRGMANPGAFDFERWAYIREVDATGYVRDSVHNRRLADSGDCALTAARFRMATRIAAQLEGRRAMPFVVALAVGLRDWLAASDRDLLRDSGTAHLLAISGLHIGLVAGLALVLGRLIGGLLLCVRVPCRPFFLARIVALVAAIVYSVMAGFALPTVRALVMLTIVIALSFVRRAWTGLSVLGSALYFVLCIDPAAPVTAGFWLSFTAVGVLMLQGLGRCADRPVPLAGLTAGLRAAVPAQMAIALGLAPLAILIFGRLSWIAPAVNLIFIPLFGVVIVPLVLAGTLLLLISERFGGWVLSGAEIMTAQLLALLGQLMTRLDGVWQTPAVTWPVAVLLAISALIAIWPRPLPGRPLWLAGLIASVAICYSVRINPALQIVVMDVGHGLAVLVRNPDYTLLYDTGPGYGVRDAGESVVVPVLRRLGVKHLDAIIVSHFDADHSGGLASVLRQYPAKVLANPVDAAAFSPAIAWSPCVAPARWAAGALLFRIVSPNRDDLRRLRSDNDSSCVLMVEYGNFRLLLPGDIEQVAESFLVASNELLAVDIVVAPHHGSKTSSSAEFVDRVAAKYVIYSVGHDNRWGFPQADVVHRWQAVSDCQLSTAQSGAILIELPQVRAEPQLRTRRATSARIWNEPTVNHLPCPAGAIN